MDIDTQLTLKNKVSVIGSVSDFTYKWGMNAGLSEEDAVRLSLAVDELVTDVVLFAFGDEEGRFDVLYRWNPSSVEVIVREFGEPFDPERHRYDPERALREGNFEGAGFEVIRHMVDDFVFINKGRGGKEFRLVKKTSGEHIADLLVEERPPSQTLPAPDTTYVIEPAHEEDAEDIAKLIYRTYGYTYVKEELYFPKKIALAFEREEKFGVIARTSEGEAVGYFAVLRTTDSRIGEVGEAVVAVPHRKRGIMTRMLHRLIEMSRERGLLGLFGEAVTVHTISQKANAKFHMQTTALMLADFPTAIYKGLTESYPQDVSIVIDFLPLHRIETAGRYLPPAYRAILTDIYRLLGITVHDLPPETPALAERSGIDLKISYEYKHALLVVNTYGTDLTDRLRHTLRSLRKEDVHAVYLDLPLDDPVTKTIIPDLRGCGFVFSGLMPLFHHERDYLRLQKVYVPLDFDLIHVYSEMAHRLKDLIARELQ